MWPSDTGGNCVPLWRKRKYPCVQSSVTMDNLRVAPLVWAMPDCFHVQYKFLYYDEPCFLKAGTVPSVREPGQGWEWMGRKEESLVCSLLYHGEAISKHIKASFRSPIWSVCSSVSFFSFFVDGRPAVWTEREHQVCSSKGPATFSKFGRWKGRWKDEWAGGRRRVGMGHLGIFVRKHERAFVLGGRQRSEGWLCSPCIYRACMNIWLMSHRLQGNAISELWLYKASPSDTHTHTGLPCPPV